MPKCRIKIRHSVTQPLDQSIRLIPLTRGKNTVVDFSDYGWLMQWNWHALWSKTTNSFYASRSVVVNGKKKALLMHREILGCHRGEQGDHRNHDTLDNRRDNLRKCSCADNGHNRCIQRNNTSGFKGVTWSKGHDCWVVQIRFDGRRKWIGGFATAEEAAKTYDTIATDLHGEFAVLNFPS